MFTFTNVLLLIVIAFLIINAVIGILNFVMARSINSSNDEVKNFKKQFSSTGNKITETHRVVNDIIGYVRDIATRPSYQQPRYNGGNGYRGNNNRDFGGGGYRGNPNGYNRDRPPRRYDNDRPRYGEHRSAQNETERFGDDNGADRSFDDRTRRGSTFIPKNDSVPDGKASRDMISDLTGDSLGRRTHEDMSHLATTVEDHSDEVNFEDDYHDDNFDERDDIAADAKSTADDQIRGDISDEEFIEEMPENETN